MDRGRVGGSTRGAGGEQMGRAAAVGEQGDGSADLREIAARA